MGGVDVGGGGKKRATNSDVNMIPFIDLLMVTIAFLLITAVWVNHSRIDADAQVPGPPGCGEDCVQPVEKTLHVTVGENEFDLAWRQGATVVSETKLPRRGEPIAGEIAGNVRYPDLAKAITDEWHRQGVHTDPLDRKADRAVLHTDDRLAFKELIAVMDAVDAGKRNIRFPDGSTREVPAFATTFSVH